MAIQSTTYAGNVTAPTALATIATSGAVLTPGTYDVTYTAYQTGTPDGLDSNAQFKLVTANLIIGPVLIASVVNPGKIRVTVPAAGETLLLQAINNATAGAIYNCGFSMTRVQPAISQS